MSYNYIREWNCAVDKGNVFDARLIYLSKTLYCLLHKEINATLNAYGFILPALNIILNYLSNRLQRTENNSYHNSWSEMLFTVPGPMLFSIFSSHLFLVMNDVKFANYGGEGTIYDSAGSIDNIVISLHESRKRNVLWLSDNQTKGNTAKCHLIMNTDGQLQNLVRDSSVKRSN